MFLNISSNGRAPSEMGEGCHAKVVERILV
nr:MAG TPA: hypothetical protein [Caudoviricetes sp.]